MNPPLSFVGAVREGCPPATATATQVVIIKARETKSKAYLNSEQALRLDKQWPYQTKSWIISFILLYDLAKFDGVTRGRFWWPLGEFLST